MPHIRCLPDIFKHLPLLGLVPELDEHQFPVCAAVPTIAGHVRHAHRSQGFALEAGRQRGQGVHAGNYRQHASGGGISPKVSAPPRRQSQGEVVTRIQRAIVAAAVAGGLAWASSASAQIGFTNLNTNPTAANAAFPKQNPLGPSGTNYQVNYPYPGQCVAEHAERGALPRPCSSVTSLPATSFAATPAAGVSQRYRGGWAVRTRSRFPFKTLAPGLPNPAPSSAWEVLNPPTTRRTRRRTRAPTTTRSACTRPTASRGSPSAGLFPNSDRRPPARRSDRHAVDRPHLQHRRRLRLPGRRERRFRGTYCRPAARSRSAPRSSRRSGASARSTWPVARSPQVLTSLGSFSPGTAVAPGRRTTTSPPGPRSASAARPARRSS